MLFPFGNIQKKHLDFFVVQNVILTKVLKNSSTKKHQQVISGKHTNH